jgi:hypothetical protein
MTDITISLTDSEVKALEAEMSSIQDWADNALKNRARISGDAIIAKLVAHCNENEVAMAVGRDAQILQAFDLELAEKASDVEAKMLALEKEQAESQVDPATEMAAAVE